MTNETRAALVLLREQLSAAEEALASYDALVAALQHSAFGAGISEATATAERSLSAVRALARRQEEYLAEAVAREPNPREHFAAVRAMRAVQTRHERLRERVRTAEQLLEKSAEFIRYQLNVVSGTMADDTYGCSQPVAGPPVGLRREIAMFDADV